MIPPVRCFTCGKVLADKWAAYEKMCIEADEKEPSKNKAARGEILDKLGLTSICCRTAMLTHVDLSLVI